MSILSSLNFSDNLESVKFGTVRVSVSQSLLIAYDAIEKSMLEVSSLSERRDYQEALDYIKKLFLVGVRSEEDRLFIKELTETLLQHNIQVDSSERAIIEDPVKRYFETYLARNILTHLPQQLPLEKLSRYKDSLQMRLKAQPSLGNDKSKVIDQILQGEVDEDMLNYEREFAELIGQFKEGRYADLPKEALKRLYYIACSTIVATINTMHDEKLPIQTYEDSIFGMDLGGRGRKKKSEEVRGLDKPREQFIQSGALGMLLSTSPVSMYDPVAYRSREITRALSKDKSIPVKQAVVESSIQRPADQAEPLKGSAWNQYHFSRMTQPYSNGISSTTFAQLRNMILQKRKGKVQYDPVYLRNYLTSFAAMIVYTGGGHGFFEIFEVFKLKGLKELFEHGDYKALLDKDELMFDWLNTSLQSKEHGNLFESALDEARAYSQHLLLKKKVQAELQIKKNFKEPPADKERNIPYSLARNAHNRYLTDVSYPYFPHGKYVFDAIIKDDPRLLKRTLMLLKHHYSVKDCRRVLDSRAYSKWTPLMVAAQLGRKDCVKVLLGFKAKINAKALNCTALDLAIKHNQPEIVVMLLDAGATLRNNWQSRQVKNGLKKWSMALYLLCRQSDTTCLQIIMNRYSFDAKTLQIMFKEAVMVENVEAVEYMLLNCRCDLKELLDEEFKSSLILDLINLGNAALIQTILRISPYTTDHYNSDIYRNYITFLNKTVKEDYIILTRLLLNEMFKAVRENVRGETRADRLMPWSLAEDSEKIIKYLLQKREYTLALKMLMWGCRPSIIDSTWPNADEFLNHLKTADLKLLKEDLVRDEMDVEVLQGRLKCISRNFNKLESSWTHHLKYWLCKVLCALLPSALQTQEMYYAKKYDYSRELHRVMDTKFGRGPHQFFSSGSGASDAPPVRQMYQALP